ncbi:MAG TPA: sigma-70 family RNA polymerase sigma factor [Thermomicrobiales bacterium]|nr:sigma-70 family RNA polymerase sigma factor [Thermomicrobiales bacterium]HQZ88958.1 sigma-70 family RNA polymerase sigma factor [Thermomicrobiales bacterium]HRA31888.1 sigma-70 family RNA polymerase sigma factor [Thermomicrobiales bacterium]
MTADDERPASRVTATMIDTKASDPSDHTLLRESRGGDARAFEALFTRYYLLVYGVVARIVGDAAEAEELTQETFLRLYLRPIEATESANVRAWLLRVGTNAAFNAVRARRRRAGWLRRLAGRADARATGDDPSSIVADRDEADRVRQVLAQLPERQRAALALRASGLSYAEVAGVLGVRPGSVGTILARAERAFREKAGGIYLADGGEE